MRNDKITVTFDFEFEYRNPRTGGSEFTNAITVCEPGWEQRALHRKMQSYVSEAQKGLLKQFAQDRASVEQADQAEPAKVDDGKPSEGPDAMTVIRLGLGIDAYSAFCELVQRELKGQRTLAYCTGDQALPVADRVPLTEQEWMNLAEVGGMDGVDKVISAFAGFFMGTRPAATSPTTSGTPSPSVSAPSPTAGSRTRKH